MPQNGNERSLPEIFVDMVDAPAKAFKTIFTRRGAWMWILPILVLVITFAVAMVAQAPYSAELAQQQAQIRIASLPADQAEAAQAQIDTFTSLPFVLGTSLVSGLLMILIGLLGQSVIFYFGAIVLGAEIKFGDTFKMSAWSRLPQALRYLVLGLFMFISGQQVRYPGLSSLVATGDIMKDGQNPLTAVLGIIDPFWIWHLFLALVGLSVLANFKRSKSLGLTIAYAVVSIVAVGLPVLLVGGLGS